ncbi:pyridoxal phosphate-dependent aminotransferase [Bacteroidota bacterium]
MTGANRIQSIPTSIFSTMSKMAVENHAVNLGQGFPDFSGPEWIMEEAYNAMLSGMNGILSLRKKLAENFEKYYNFKWNYDSEITITAGATEALFSTILSLINPGDEVILFEPFYDAYQSDVILAGGIPKYVTLKKPGFSFDFQELEKEISEKTKLIILNNPHNPTGKIFSDEELEIIADLAIKNDLLVISDEVYEFLLFDDNKHTPIVTLPGMKERTITISSTGKTFGLTGWKIGFACAKPELTKAIQKVHQWATFAVNTPGQHAMAYAFGRIEDYLPEFRETYQHKRDLLFNLLKETNFKAHLPNGSYFMMIDIPDNKKMNDVECATELVKNYGVATIPPSVFYAKSDEGQTMLRLCFAKNDDTIIEGINKLKKF